MDIKDVLTISLANMEQARNAGAPLPLVEDGVRQIFEASLMKIRRLEDENAELRAADLGPSRHMARAAGSVADMTLTLKLDVHPALAQVDALRAALEAAR